MKNKISICLLLTASILTSSCAGLVGGKTQNIFVRTSDGSENVQVDITSATGTQTTKIPSSIVVSRNQMPLTISVKEGKCIKESKTYATTKYNIWLLADAIGGLFGLTGTTSDMSSGAAWAYEDNIVVNVSKKDGCK